MSKKYNIARLCVTTAAGFVLLSSTALIAPANGAEKAKDGVVNFDTTIAYTFPGTPRVAISRHGNVVDFEGPAGYQHIYTEGYVLCYGLNNAYDIGIYESGFSAASAFSCSGSTCTVTRNTADGRLELRQVITKNVPFERSFNVQMRVRNLTGSRISGIILRRHVDFDVDAPSANYFMATESDSVVGWNPADASAAEDHAAMIRFFRRTPTTIPTFAKVVNWPDSSCSPTNYATGGPVFGDYGATIQYDVGSLAAGASATVEVQYQRN
jgi:hypothetical protein